MEDRGATPWGGRIHFRASTTSTMDDAQVLEDAGHTEGSVAWAGFQTAGRGRYPGRVWSSEADQNLTFTVFWSPQRFRVPHFAPSLTVGLGICLWLEALNLQAPIALKWPNDVYLADKKLAGILVRSRWAGSGPRSIHAGIGINLVSPGAPEQAAFRTAAAWLAEWGIRVSPEEALKGALPFLDEAILHPDPRSACEARLWRRKQSFELSLPGGEPQQGIALGIDNTGCLIWEGPEGVRIVNSGE